MEFAFAITIQGRSAMTDQNEQRKRSSNFELLRIITMILIVASHFTSLGKFQFSNETISINRLWIQFMTMSGKIGVNVFVLISGYFLIDSNKYKTEKSVRMWFQIFTYSIIAFVLFVFIFKSADFSIKGLIKSVFPITFRGGWWFARAYFVLYILSPFINRFLHALNEKEYRRLLVVVTVMWCIIPTCTGQTLESNELLWFMYLYSLIGYFKIYKNNIDISGSRCIVLALISVMITFASVIVFDIIGTRIRFLADHALFFSGMQSLLTVITAMLLVVGFSKINIGYKKHINVVASATFGVYLIHENNYIRPFLWERLFKNASYTDSNLLIPYSIAVTLLVFVAATIIELARKNLIENHSQKLFLLVATKIDRVIDKIQSIRLFKEN